MGFNPEEPKVYIGKRTSDKKPMSEARRAAEALFSPKEAPKSSDQNEKLEVAPEEKAA